MINHSEVKELAESRTMPAGADWPQFEESFYGADRATILIQRSSVVDGTRTRSFSCHSYLWRAAPSSLPLFLVPASTLRGPVCACVSLSLASRRGWKLDRLRWEKTRSQQEACGPPSSPSSMEELPACSPPASSSPSIWWRYDQRALRLWKSCSLLLIREIRLREWNKTAGVVGSFCFSHLGFSVCVCFS